MSLEFTRKMAGKFTLLARVPITDLPEFPQKKAVYQALLLNNRILLGADSMFFRIMNCKATAPIREIRA